jgi:hypothetical protein
MTKTKRWLDELPPESSERELLLVGKSARPAPGAIDANWQALSMALGTTAISGVAASGIVASSVSTKVGTSLAVSQATSAGLLVVAAKSLAVGAVVGFAVMGASAVVERVSQSDERPTTAGNYNQAPTARGSSNAPLLNPIAARPVAVSGAPVSSAPGQMPSLPAAGERLTASSSLPNLGSAPAAPRASAAPNAPAADNAASLSQQARELAELKRLIDNGATDQALRRLDTNLKVGAGSVLAEERDALYVQALDRAQRRAEARAFAQQFLIRYPHSPYRETMRRLLTSE